MYVTDADLGRAWCRSALLAIVKKNMTRDTNLTNLTNNIQIVIHLIMEEKI